MKTRIDFVSNSSSCSFIIEEPKKFIDFVNAEFDANDFYAALECLNVSVKANVANKNTVNQVFGKDHIYEYENEMSIGTSLEKLASLDSDVLEKIDKIEFECDDYDTDNVVKLSVLRRALDKSGIKVFDNSEHDLLFTDDDAAPSTMAKLYFIAFSKKT